MTANKGTHGDPKLLYAQLWLAIVVSEAEPLQHAEMVRIWFSSSIKYHFGGEGVLLKSSCKEEVAYMVSCRDCGNKYRVGAAPPIRSYKSLRS